MHVRRGGEPVQATHESGALADIHSHADPGPTRFDTGGVLSGSEDSYWFAKAYAGSPPCVRERVLDLSAPGGQDGHAIARVVRAEVGVLRELDAEIREIPSDELERAILRYWANTFGREGSLHVLGSRFNHSCVPNCTPAETSSSTASATETPRTFLTLRPVARGEELTLSYLPSKLGAMGAVIRRRHLWLSRGFLCNCTLCSEGQDYLRRVRCPDCASRRHPQPSHVPSGRCRSSGETGSASVGSRLRAEPPGGAETEEVFADWWSRSNMWVCRWCGWCSDPNGALHRREAALSAEVFSFVMAQTLVEDRLPLPLGEGGLGAGCNGISGTRAPRESHDGRRSSIEDMLRASVRILGRRHWVTFCCLLMRLELDMVLLESSNASLLAPTPPVNLDRASRELEGLWLWLELAPLVLAPEYYLFDLVCSVAVVGLGRAGALWSAADELLSRVGTWASVFADGHQRKKLQTSRAVVLRNLNER